ncbi:MAG: membrane dipeptidase [Acetobacteraceae bacterium]|nr:membrane dipeptidase [Acetobacteraceae bacterium]
MTDSDPATWHASLLTIDTHIDIPWPTGPSPFERGPRHVDLPKMREGGLAVGFFAAYVPQQRRTPENEQAAYDRAIAMLHAIRGMGAARNDITARIAVTADEIMAIKRDGVLGIVPCVENGFSIGTDLSRLAEFRALGARYLTITHNGHNALADAAIARPDLGDSPAEHGGLSALGRDAIGIMNQLGMLIDVSHICRDAMLQAAAISRSPIVATHSCVRALCDHPRNMDDAQLDVLRDVGGVIQITAVSAFLRAKARPEDVTPVDFADHIDYAVRRIGLDHVGISSDFDGGGWFAGWRDASESANITTELIRRGYDRAALRQLWGGNFLRVMRQAEEIADA